MQKESESSEVHRLHQTSAFLSAELIHVALLAPRIYRWLLDFWKISGIFVSGMGLEAFNWVEIFILL